MQTVQQNNAPSLGIHPKKFALWAGIASIIMFFVALTSALIVKKTADVADGNWLEFKIPIQFYFSTAVIVASSITLMLAKKGFNAGDIKTYRMWLSITFVLGVVFIFLQYFGWVELTNIGVYLTGKTARASGSFFYVLSGTHAAHILGGLIAMFFILIKALRKGMIFQKRNNIELISIYWHFVDILWLYLFALLLL